MSRSYTSSPPTCLHGMQRDSCTFTFAPKITFPLRLEIHSVEYKFPFRTGSVLCNLQCVKTAANAM
jgi:hypothetical protein